MSRVKHTCDVVYGSYSGTIDVICHEDDDLEAVKAKVRKQADLNFLAMATYSVKIVNTTPLND